MPTATQTPPPTLDRVADRKAAARAWPDRVWEHPSLADWVQEHRDELAPLIAKTEATGDAFRQLLDRQRAITAQDDRLQSDLIEAAGDEADRLISDAIRLHTEKQTLPARLTEHERRFMAARTDLLERVQQMATAEAQEVEAGIVQPRRDMAAIDRQLINLDSYGTRPEIREARAELNERRAPLARTVVAGNRRFTELRDVVAIARAMTNRGQMRSAA